jgi:hypothetical protein
MRQTEIVLAGMRVGDVLQKEVNEFLTPVGKIIAVYNDAIIRIDAIQKEVVSGSSLLTPDKRTVIQSVLSYCEGKTESVGDIFKTLLSGHKKLHARIRWVGRKTEEGKKDVKAVYEATSKALADISDKMREYREKKEHLANLLRTS